MGVFDKINDGLTGKTPDSVPGKASKDAKPVPANSNIEKMQSLGLKSMPEDGQEGLDRMYSESQSQKPKKKSRMETMYKGIN